MTKLQVLGVAALIFLMAAPDGMAQRRGGGAARSGMRGAMIGGLAGGSEAAKKGAKIGVVAGATRNAADRASERNSQQTAVDKEAVALADYQESAEYKDSEHSNFNAIPPAVIVASASIETADRSKDGVIRRDGKPVLAITYPANWKQKSGKHFICAASADGKAWSILSTLDDIKDKKAGVEKIKKGLSNELQDIQFDELTKTKNGALVVTGTGKGKKAGVDVVFAAGIFDSGEKQLSGVAFIVDADIEDYCKNTVRSICQSIRVEEDFADDATENREERRRSRRGN